MTYKPFDLEEIWIPVIGYEKRYEVSNRGNVKSLSIKYKNKLTSGYAIRKGRIKNQRISTLYKYFTVSLWKNYKSKTVLVHRLVAQAFLSNKKNLPQVNHKDGNKLNNDVKNLEWVSQEQNMQHALKIGLLIRRTRKLTMKQAEKIRKIRHKFSVSELACKYEVSKSTILNIVQRKFYNE